MDCRAPGLPVPHHLLKFAQVHVHCIGDAIQPSHPLMPSSPSALNLYQGFFQWVSCSHLMTKILEFQSQSFQWVFRVDFPWDWLVGVLAVQGTLRSLLQHHSLKASILRPSTFFMVQLSQPYMTTLKTTTLTIRTFVCRVMSLLFNALSWFVITFLPRSKCLLISCLQSPSRVILEPKKRESVTTSTFPPSIWREVMEPDTSILVYLIFNFKLALSLSPLTLIKRLISSSLLSAIKVVSSAYLRLLMFLPPIFITARNSSSLAFLMICSAYRLSKQVNSRQPCSTPFSILNQSVVPYRVLNVASWPTCWFLRRQVRWTGIPIYLRAFHSLLWWIMNAIPWWHYSLGFWIVLLEFCCIH